MVPGSKAELPGDLHIGHLSFGDDGKGGKIAIMVQEQMQFDGPFGSAEMGPVKEADATDQ